MRSTATCVFGLLVGMAAGGCATIWDLNEVKDRVLVLERNDKEHDKSLVDLKKEDKGLGDSLADVSRRHRGDIARLGEKVDSVSEVPSDLQAKIKATIAYLAKVEEHIDEFRIKTLTQLADQNEKVRKGREAYLAVLIKEHAYLQARLKEIDRALGELGAKLPKAETVIPETPKAPRSATTSGS